MKHHFSPTRAQHGQAMVEFSLVIFFIFVLFVSILQMILLMHAYNTVADAAKEGVRYAIVHGTGNSTCSGPGDPTTSPKTTCTDGTAPYQNVQQAVVNFATVSFQNIALSDVSVDYDPNSANTNAIWGAACSAPGCMVKVTISHQYALFFVPWLNFHLDAAAGGRIVN